MPLPSWLDPLGIWTSEGSEEPTESIGPTIGLTEIVAVGTNVVAAWPDATPLPGQVTLEAAAKEIGEPFTLTYLFHNHQGVTLGSEMTGQAISVHFAKATAGQTPLLISMPPDIDDAVVMEKRGGEFKKQVDGLLDDLANASSLSINLPRYMLIGGLFLGGLLIVGAGIYFYKKRKG